MKVMPDPRPPEDDWVLSYVMPGELLDLGEEVFDRG